MAKFQKNHIPWNKGKQRIDIVGSKHWNWKGGKKINSQGYILIYSPAHSYKDKQGYVREHRLIIEQSIGRYLLPSEEVHHINHIKNDNRLENLQLFSNGSDHTKYGHPAHKGIHLKKICPICYKSFYVFPSLKRLICCSINCAAKKRWKKGKIVFGR